MLILCSLCFSASAQNVKQKWVDSVFQTLTLRQKIGQLFMIPVSGYAKNKEVSELVSTIKAYTPGGILVTKGGPAGTAKLLNLLQEAIHVPLFTGIHAGRGLGQTLDSITPFPTPIMVKAIQDNNLLYSMGTEIGRNMKLLGIHINFTPEIGTLALGKNPTYYTSPAGKNPDRVIEGLQRQGIVVCTKYSPHPQYLKDTSNPIHQSAPRKQDSYQNLFHEGIDGFLMPTSGFPSNFSFLRKQQRKKKSSKKLIFIRNTNTSGGKIEEWLFAPYSNMIILEQGSDIGRSVHKVIKALKHTPSLKKKLKARIKENLSAKYDAGLINTQQVNTDNIPDKVNSEYTRVLKMKLAEASVTVVQNKAALIPIRTLGSRSFLSVSIGSGHRESFTRYLSKFAPFTQYAIQNPQDTLDLHLKIRDADVVVISLYTLSSALKKDIIPWINKLDEKQKIILCSFSDPYDLSKIEALPSIVVGYSDEDPVPMLTGQILFGTYQGKGKLPVTLAPSLQTGQGNPNITLNRLGYGIPEWVGMDSKKLNQIKLIAQEAIDSRATPGCRIIVAKGGKVVVDESFGWKTYNQEEPVTENTIYDLSSLTKVAATLQTVMVLYEKNLIDINKKAWVYLPELKNSNKQDCTIKDILTHQAGLWPFLPFWIQTVNDSESWIQYYDSIQNDEYHVPVAQNMFTKKAMQDSLWKWVIQSDMIKKKHRMPYEYKYSDMGFYILQRLVEKLLNQPIEDFLTSNIYKPLGAYTIGYLPLNRFPISQIAPTEEDAKFRKSILRGFVHDQGAAMYGGIAGHAGLFSNANDLAKLGQMWLQKGSYGGIQYFKPETIDQFTKQQYYTNRRGLGWDRPITGHWHGPTSLYASPKTFGHTGFTGTALWVDPEFDLVYVFLSNRIYPDAKNSKLVISNIRTRIQDVIYQSIFDHCKNSKRSNY